MPHRGVSLARLSRIWGVCTSFQFALTVKIWMDLLKGLRSYGSFKLRGRVSTKLSALPSGETVRWTRKSFEVLERTWGPLSPCQVWWGSDFTHCWGSQKHLVFCLCVSLSLCHACELVLWIDIRISGYRSFKSISGCEIGRTIIVKFSRRHPFAFWPRLRNVSSTRSLSIYLSLYLYLCVCLIRACNGKCGNLSPPLISPLIAPSRHSATDRPTKYT